MHSATSSIQPVDLRCEYLRDPIGIDALRPRLSWVLEGSQRGARQTAYRVMVLADVAAGANSASVEAGTAPPVAGGEPPSAEWRLLWDSGRVASSASTHIEYCGPPLRSRARCRWSVMVWDESGRSATSTSAHWEMGLLEPTDWGASWIGLGNASPFGTPLPKEGTRPRRSGAHPAGAAAQARAAALSAYGEWRPSPYLRTAFQLESLPSYARLYVTAQGLYEPRLNGERVGDARLSPGWTDYNERVQYQTYDVTQHLQRGSNVLAARLGDGWYAGHLGFDPRWPAYRYGYRPSLLARLELTLGDGSSMAIVSDRSWRTGTGAITFADLLMGEAHDARLEPVGWDKEGFDDSEWEHAAIVEVPPAKLVAQSTPPVRVTEELPARSVRKTPSGAYIFDIGQNMVGWARLSVEGPPGTVATLRFGEALDGNGDLYVENLRRAKQTDVFVLSGKGRETFEPRFTFHGFRFVEVSGLPSPPEPEDLVGCVAHDDLERAGAFECSSTLLNQLHRNIVWSQRGNFLSVPTDCPQRDERLGWLGDAQVFARTAAYCMNVAPFFTKWLIDVRDAQSTEGAFSDVAPRTVLPSDGAPGWGDGGVLLPWAMYLMYGDLRLLEEHYEAMRAWMRYLGEANPTGLRTRRLNMSFGDWLSVEADTDKELLATAYYALDADRMTRIARALGRDDDAAEFESLFNHIRSAFLTAYVDENGQLRGGTQTACLLAIHAGLLPKAALEGAVRLLVEDIGRRGRHLSTGFLGVGLLAPVLSDIGHADLAYRLALCDTYPSWGYSIRHGATTIWERWDGWTEEAGFQTPQMNSFNHYAFGSVGEWLYRYVAGIDVDRERPGFEHIVLRPRPGGGLAFAEARYRSIRGDISSRWELRGGVLTYEATVPANATATLHLPTPHPESVRESGKLVAEAAGVDVLPVQDNSARFHLQSGRYRFECVIADSDPSD